MISPHRLWLSRGPTPRFSERDVQATNEPWKLGMPPSENVVGQFGLLMECVRQQKAPAAQGRRNFERCHVPPVGFAVMRQWLTLSRGTSTENVLISSIT